MEIEKKGIISVSELAHCMSLDKSTVSRNVDSLLNLGLIKREIPAENRRKALVSLTETGQETCNEINSENDKYICDIISILTSKEQTELLKMFGRITDNMALLRKVNSG